MFGRAAETVADAIADARTKLIDEGWFGRRAPEHHGRSDLGWFQDHPSASGHAPEHPDALTQFYNRLSPAERTEFFCDPPERGASAAAPEHERGIDL